MAFWQLAKDAFLACSNEANGIRCTLAFGLFSKPSIFSKLCCKHAPHQNVICLTTLYFPKELLPCMSIANRVPYKLCVVPGSMLPLRGHLEASLLGSAETLSSFDSFLDKHTTLTKCFPRGHAWLAWRLMSQMLPNCLQPRTHLCWPSPVRWRCRAPRRRQAGCHWCPAREWWTGTRVPGRGLSACRWPWRWAGTRPSLRGPAAWSRGCCPSSRRSRRRSPPPRLAAHTWCVRHSCPCLCGAATGEEKNSTVNMEGEGTLVGDKDKLGN